MVEMPRAESFEAATPVATMSKAAVAPGHKVAKRAAITLALLLGTVGAYHYGTDYLTVGRYLQSTDDAYVKTDFTTVAPKVAGYISEVLVADNQAVKAGNVLARIDDRDFRSGLAQAQADVTAARAAIRNIDAEVALQSALIDQAHATVTATEATLTFAKADAERYRALTQTGAGTVQRSQQTESVRAETAAQLLRDQAALVAARSKIDVLTSERARAEAQRDRAVALAHQAELNLSYTIISAPVDGTVGARTLRVGQYVTAGTQLMAIVPLHAAYIIANFKETQLTFVREGQPVKVEVDGFPGRKVKGHVDSLSPASGLEFSLLPPDNATGNFTKIVQRIPVKIVLDTSGLSGFLRAGMSVEPTIDTKAAVLAEQPKPAISAPMHDHVSQTQAAWFAQAVGHVLDDRSTPQS